MAIRAAKHTDSLPGALNEARAASTAGGGTALSSTAVLVVLPDGTTQVVVLPRNFATALVAKLALNPYLVVLATINGLGAVTDASGAAQDGLSVTSLSLNAFPTLANGGALYIGSHVPFRGTKVTMSGSVNANASVLAVKYWNGTAWTNITPTDGTANGGATLAQSGNVTWSVPTDWATGALQTIQQPVKPFVHGVGARYWTQWAVSAVLSATVSVLDLLAFNRSTAYAELTENSAFNLRTFKGVGGLASLEALTDAGTANLIVNVFNEPGGHF